MEENNENVQYCTNCGTKLTSNSNFCPNCGKKIIKTENEISKNQPIQSIQQDTNNKNTNEIKNDIVFNVDGSKLKQIYKAVENQGPYFNEFGSKMIWVSILIIVCGVFLPGFFILFSADSMDNPIDMSPITLVFILIAFAGLLLWVSIIRLRGQKIAYLGEDHRTVTNGKWLLYMHTYDTSGINENRVSYTTDAIIVNLKHPTTKITYNNETNIINLTGFLLHASVINNKIFFNDKFEVSLKENNFLTKLTEFIETQNYSYDDEARIKNIEIPNCFNPDLYEYLKNIIK